MPKRIQLEFNDESYERLLAIERRAGARTHAEAIRRALNLFDWYLKYKDANPKLTAQPDGTPTPVEFVPIEV